MKQSDLATRLSISTSYLSEIEADKKSVSVDLLERYASVFRVPASTFLRFGHQGNSAEHRAREVRAERLIKFYEWVLSDDEGSGDDDGTRVKEEA